MYTMQRRRTVVSPTHSIVVIAELLPCFSAVAFTPDVKCT